MLDAILLSTEGGTATPADELESIFIEVLYGSLGATVTSECREQFDGFVKKIASFIAVDDTDTKLATYSKYTLLL